MTPIKQQRRNDSERSYRPKKTASVRWARLVSLALLLMGLVIAAESAQASSPPKWSAPTPISPNLPTSWFPDLNADPTGIFRLAWAANLSWDVNSEAQHETTGAVMVSQLGDKGWSPSNDIRVMDAGIASRPLIASDGTYVNMLYRTGIEGTTTLNYMRALTTSDLSNPHSWTNEITIATGAYYAQIMALPDQSLVVLYNQLITVSPEVLAQSETPVNRLNLLQDAADTPPDVRPVLYARRSSDHGITWSDPVRISVIGERVGRVSLASSADGSLLVSSWDQGYDNNTGIGDPTSVATAVSKDQGRTWQHVQTITSPVGPIEQSVVATNGNASVLVYRSTVVDKIYYRVSKDGGATWSAEQPIPHVIARPYLGKHNFDKLSMAVDGDGRMLLAYVGKKTDRDGGLSVMVTTFADDSWTSPVAVDTPVGFAEYPRIAVGLGNEIQIVYFVRDNEFSGGHYTLWSVGGKSDAKAIPAVNPAPPPASTASVATTPVAVQITSAPPVPAPPTHTYASSAPMEGPRAIQRNPIVQASVASLVAVLGLLILSNMFRLVRNRLG